ncbi:MAG TPA: glycoside hydrolase family 9 protein [Bacteroidales bacterium]|nr:glycoside hydrolase family 9 protein [Bacteroidales bacterium]
MKKLILVLLTAVMITPGWSAGRANSWIRVNQAGYLPGDIKVAVVLSLEEKASPLFEVFDAITGKPVFKGAGKMVNAAAWGMKSAYRLDFSKIEKQGGYYIVSNGEKSPNFRITTEAYDGLADYLLVYMRQQRCGDNPYTGHLCHQDDGYIVDHPTRSGEKIDVRGGWHDATDYLQYQTTSATTVYHLMFAWEQQKDKSVFKDMYNASGRAGSNGIPDILDEIRWGLDWLMRMNPEDKVMFNQIADDRDHAGFRLPQNDKVDYGWGPGTGRPVYFVTGKPQGLGKHINRTTGVASTAGKFASSFAMGAEIFKDRDPQFAAQMKTKAQQAFNFAVEKPGNTQTACVVSPYFYEEDTYVDDIELAAATFYNYTKDDQWKTKADYWGELEPVSPWMELGRGRHYQYYPFINLGHYYLATSSDPKVREKYVGYMKQGLEDLRSRAGDDPFVYGIPFLWCSNNLVSAAITQAHLYRKATGDNTFLEMEMALRDWLFGCNPWGTSMIVGFPKGGDFPDSPHSSYTANNGDLTYGGLVDGPIERNLFITRAGNALRKADSYAVFNNGRAVYHDDMGDYSSNEPTMDGTAGLSYYFASMENEGKEIRSSKGDKVTSVVKDSQGAIVRINPDKKVIYLIFSADSMFQGGEKIIGTLAKNKIKGSFFLTGNFARLPQMKPVIAKMIDAGHYVGAHSDRHLLYAPWDKRDISLVAGDSLINDIKRNIQELEKFGIKPADALWFLPPYEWYNKESVYTASVLGFKTINYTPGTATPADYTEPSMKSYKTSRELMDKLFAFEKEKNLNGALILIHPGVVAERPDKLYDSLDSIIKRLKKLGYTFEKLY